MLSDFNESAKLKTAPPRRLTRVGKRFPADFCVFGQTAPNCVMNSVSKCHTLGHAAGPVFGTAGATPVRRCFFVI